MASHDVVPPGYHHLLREWVLMQSAPFQERNLCLGGRQGVTLRRKLDCTAAGINLTATQRSGQGGTNASDFYRAFSPPTRSSNWPSPGLGHESMHLSCGPDSKPQPQPARGLQSADSDCNNNSSSTSSQRNRQFEDLFAADDSSEHAMAA